MVKVTIASSNYDRHLPTWPFVREHWNGRWVSIENKKLNLSLRIFATTNELDPRYILPPKFCGKEPKTRTL
jgi:hypothetical protein